MNLMNQMMSSESNPKLNINGTVKGCECEECIPSNEEIIKNQALKEYPSLSEKEIEEIINERYFYKD